jgi:hypothetical protein
VNEASGNVETKAEYPADEKNDGDNCEHMVWLFTSLSLFKLPMDVSSIHPHP